MTTKEFFGRSWQSDEELLDEFIAKSTLSAKLLIIRPGNTKGVGNSKCFFNILKTITGVLLTTFSPRGSNREGWFPSLSFFSYHESTDVLRIKVSASHIHLLTLVSPYSG